MHQNGLSYLDEQSSGWGRFVDLDDARNIFKLRSVDVAAEAARHLCRVVVVVIVLSRHFDIVLLGFGENRGQTFGNVSLFAVEHRVRLMPVGRRDDLAMLLFDRSDAIRHAVNHDDVVVAVVVVVDKPNRDGRHVRKVLAVGCSDVQLATSHRQRSQVTNDA